MKFAVIAFVLCAVLVAVCCTSSTEVPCFCQRIYLPVCSADGTTYPNNCTLNCASAVYAHDGTCSGDSTESSLSIGK